MTKELNEKLIIQLLEKAIEINEFYFLYQPKVTKNNTIIGVETLIRWNNSILGNVAPSVFIPLAERYGLITKLTELAIEQTIRQCSQWSKKQINLNVAINVSTIDLSSEKTILHFYNTLNKFAVNPSQITLEITETAMIENREQCAAVLATMRALGVNLAVDDFGTGHASFIYLKYFPITEIKLDQLFIKNMLQSNFDKKLIRGMIMLSKEIGCKTVAEGVENYETAQILCEMDVDILQGYFFSKPTTAENIEKLIKKTEKENA